MFDEILQGCFDHWHGLLPQPTLDELAGKLGAAVIHRSRERNRIAARHSVNAIERPSRPSKWEAWIPVGERVVSILECDDPVCPDIEATLLRLGEPEIVLDDQRLSVDYTVSEFVFPQRGMVLSVGKPFYEGRRSLLHLRLFPPMSLQRYLTDVGEPNPAMPKTNA